jgi:hypothetical protein
MAVRGGLIGQDSRSSRAGTAADGPCPDGFAINGVRPPR